MSEHEGEAEEPMTLSEALNDGRRPCQECRRPPIREWYEAALEDSDE